MSINYGKSYLKVKKIESFHCKLFTALIATIILLAILLNSTTNLEKTTRRLESVKFDKTLHNTSPLFQGDFTQVSAKPILENILSQDSSKQPKLKAFGLNKLISSGSTVECSYGYEDRCTISCYGGTLEEIIPSINDLIGGNKCSEAYQSLILESTNLTNNAIGSGWLQDITVGIKGLNMISIDLEQLGEALFSGKPFGTYSNPLSLKLTNTAVRGLGKSMFLGSSISSLEIHFEMVRGITIEEDVFRDTSSSIQSIVLKQCLTSGEALMNLTGKGSILTGLQSLDLSYNLISKLENGMFAKTPNVKQIYFISSGIGEIELGAFQGLSQISQLFLSNNNLKTLPSGLFDDTRSLTALYISENPWKCECDIQWFKEYLNTMERTDRGRCRVGSDWVDMEDVDFCPQNSSSTVTTPSISSTESTVATSTQTTITSTTENTVTTNKPNNDNFVFEKILCRSLLAYSFDNIESNDKLVWYESIFKRRKIKYTFSELKDSPTFILDILGEPNSEDFLIWTNVNNRTDYGCVFNLSSSILMNLQYENTYTICLSSNDTTDTYALIANDCTAIATPPPWAHRPWLLNDQKTVAILAVVFTFITTIIVASGAIYFLVKYNPELIKGNKRVLIVKRGSYSPNVLVMPSKKDRHFSLCTDNGGYLTPKLKDWMQKSTKAPEKRYHELDTIADHNGFAENYDDPDKGIYEPPPIPPNHPSKRRDSGRPYFYSNM